MSLADTLSEDDISTLRQLIAAGAFVGVSFKHAMQFLLTDGILPASGLPAESFLALETWARGERHAPARFSTTQLKNETGRVVEHLLRGHRAVLTRHGRVIGILLPHSPAP